MSGIISIIGALLVLTVLVFFHELGHFYAGKKLGFRIDEFAIGMGPTVVSKEKDGTKFAIRALPIGGLCMFHGEDQEGKDPDCFSAQPVWKRMIVVAAGPFMNIVLAVVIAIVILMSYGEYMPGIVELTDANAPAAVAGIEVGDILLAVNDTEITYYTDCIPAIENADPAGADITLRRGDDDIVLRVNDIYDPETGANRLGIMISPVRLRYGLFGAIAHSFRYVWDIMMEMFRFLGSIFTTGIQSGDVAGPVGTISLIGQAVRAGFEVVLRLGVLISINLGIMNILPLPALDGGRLMFMVVEAVRGKAIPPEKEGMIHFAGIVLLFGLMILLTFMDVKNLFG
ncbi:MAG: site-2 protease family protein [Clostridia bacterium]|nr:site-2 protease family protein [Clostridia bacterium]